MARGIVAADEGYSVHTFAIGESNFKLGYTELHATDNCPSSPALVAVTLGAAVTNTPPPPMPPSPTTPAHFASTHISGLRLAVGETEDDVLLLCTF